MGRGSEPTISLFELREQASSREIATTASDGSEIVWCGEGPDGYIGWTTRERAEANGYEIHQTASNPELLALIEVAEAALRLVADAEAAPIPLSSATALSWHELTRALAQFRR